MLGKETEALMAEIDKMKRTDGGSAFPTDGEYLSSGMTLRDYFAGQALIGFIVSTEQNGNDTAANAYAFADAMLDARK